WLWLNHHARRNLRGVVLKGKGASEGVIWTCGSRGPPHDRIQARVQRGQRRRYGERVTSRVEWTDVHRLVTRGENINTCVREVRWCVECEPHAVGRHGDGLRTCSRRDALSARRTATAEEHQQQDCNENALYRSPRKLRPEQRPVL